MEKIEDFKFNIANFEGPLDLLLYLISKNKKDIFAISLSELTDEYVSYLQEMNENNIEVASEFVVMAATLLDIKARKLLPQLEEEDEEEQISEEEILRRISQYKIYKEVAEKINEMYKENFGSFVKAFEKIKFNKKIEDIFNVYSNILFRNQNKINKHAKEIEKIAVYEKYTVQDKVKQIVGYLNENKNMVFNNVFNSSCDNIEVVTAFLGVLELGRMKKVDIEQKYLFSDINVTRKNDCKIDIDTSTLNY
jgi:segregation and condensation protein A